MQVQVIRHHAEDSAGLIGDAFEARGASLRTHLFPDDGPLPELDGIDHVILLGATSSVYDGRDWISAELEWLRRADEAGVPVLGICFGAQALCWAHGGTVCAAGAEEIGWRLVDSADPALIPAGPWLQYHGDHCLPPPHARLLASNDFGVQAFSVGRHLAVQFHPEVDGAQLRAWLDAGARDELRQGGHDPERFLAQTVAEEPAASARAARIVEAALQIATAPPSSTLARLGHRARGAALTDARAGK